MLTGGHSVQRGKFCRSLLPLRPIVFTAIATVACPTWAATTTTFVPVADNTLIEDAGGSLSNGAGAEFYVGNIKRGALRRGLLRFDLTAIPASATVVSAQLTLQLVKSQKDSYDVTVNRLLEDWGEGASVSIGGQGAPATPGDATWTQRFFGDSPARNWATPGGSFVGAPSASSTVSPTLGPYTWVSAGLQADVQAWVQNSNSNFGWLVQNEFAPTAKAFASRDSANPDLRPVLSVTWEASNGDVPLPGWAMWLLGSVIVTELLRASRTCDRLPRN
jgi:hypothetical protein